MKKITMFDRWAIEKRKADQEFIKQSPILHVSIFERQWNDKKRAYNYKFEGTTVQVRRGHFHVQTGWELKDVIIVPLPQPLCWKVVKEIINKDPYIALVI